MARGDSVTAKPSKSHDPRRTSLRVDCLDWTSWYAGNQPNRRVRTRTHGGVTFLLPTSVMHAPLDSSLLSDLQVVSILSTG